MTLSSYLHDMLTSDEYAAIHGGTSPVFLSAEHRAVFEHYKLWFILLRESGFLEELDYVDSPQPARCISIASTSSEVH